MIDIIHAVILMSLDTVDVGRDSRLLLRAFRWKEEGEDRAIFLLQSFSL